MTWIKPSFAWALYRSGYASKHNQQRILKVQLPHAAVADLLAQCQGRDGGGGSKGRVQWDPERDLHAGEGREPRKMLNRRAIQIGLSKDLSAKYVESAIRISDVTHLARSVGEAHRPRRGGRGGTGAGVAAGAPVRAGPLPGGAEAAAHLGRRRPRRRCRRRRRARPGGARRAVAGPAGGAARQARRGPAGARRGSAAAVSPR